MAIQSDETLVTKGDLKTLYTNKILPYLGGNMMMQTGVSDYYSEDEKVIGIWTDGKPLYQKTVTGNLPTSSTGDNTIIWQNFTTNGYEFHGGEGTLNWTSGRVAVPWSGGENNKACLNIYQGNLVIYWAAAHFSGGAYIINVRYTKTTDTASSTLTTPGCYDINRPDLWPNGQEIFFGNGLYGMRKAGTATANSLQSGILLVSNVSKAACCYNKGGMIDMSGTNGTNWYDINGGWDNKGAQRQFNPLITNTSQTFRFYCQDNQNYTTQNIQYNIWFTYTK